MWTTAKPAKGCQRTMDGAKGKLDYILTDARVCFDTMWHDQLIPSQVKSSQVKSSQVKSTRTPAGEPNVRAKAEKKKIYVHQKMTNPVQPTSISQRTSKK